MKFAVAIVLCSIVVATLAVIPEEVKEKIKAANKKCQENPATSVDEAALKAWIKADRQGERPANIGPHSLCVAKGLNWIKEDGTANLEYLREKMSQREESAKVDEILNKCAKDQNTPEDTALQMLKCLVAN